MEQIAEIFRDWGHLAYPVIFVWTFLEGETVVIFGGYASYYGVLSWQWLLIAAWIGSFLGDQTWYYLGRRFGPKLLKRYPKWEPGVFHVSELMRRWGVWFILSFRFIYGVRNISSITIGMIHYPWTKFAIINFIAAGVWASSFVGFGWGFAVASEALTASLPEHILGDAVKIVGVALLAVFLLTMTLLLRRQIKRHNAEQARAHAEHMGAEKNDAP